MKMSEKKWDEDIPNMPEERYPKLNDEMREVGDKKTLKIKSKEPNKVSKAVIEKARQKEGKNLDFPARDSYNLVLEGDGEIWEFWFSTTAYSILKELKAVKEANDGVLEDTKICIERVAVGDPTRSNWKIEPVKTEA